MNYDVSFSRPVNNLSLCVINTGSKFKICNISVNFILPLTGDIASTALLPYILKRTCKKYPTPEAMSKHLASLYGASLGANVSKIGENQIITLSLSSIDDRFSLDGKSISSSAFDLLLDILFEPNLENGTFKAEDVEREKRLMIERIESEVNDKRAFALKQCIKHMCEGETFSLSANGETDDVKAITQDSLVKALKRLLSASLIQFTVTGTVDRDEVSEKIKQRFAKIYRMIDEPHTEFITSADTQRKIRESVPAKQGKLVIGLRAGMTYNEDNIHAIRVACDLFGGGVYSKLFKNVREKMSLCYYCSASFYRQKGIIIVQSGIENENEEKAANAILEQLDAMKRGDFTDEDLEASKKGLTSMILGVPDSADGLLSWYSSQMLDSSVISPKEYADKLAAVTREEVIAAACFITTDMIYMLAGEGTEDEDDEA